MKYNKEFKLKALKLWESTNFNAALTAKRLKVNRKTILEWSREFGYEKQPEIAQPEKKDPLTPPTPEQVQSIDDLKNKIVEKMYSALEVSKDIESLAKTLKILYEINPTGSAGKPKKAGGIGKKIEEKNEVIKGLMEKLKEDAEEVNSPDGDSKKSA